LHKQVHISTKIPTVARKTIKKANSWYEFPHLAEVEWIFRGLAPRRFMVNQPRCIAGLEKYIIINELKISANWLSAIHTAPEKYHGADHGAQNHIGRDPLE
jgi:hypothetical protein